MSAVCLHCLTLTSAVLFSVLVQILLFIVLIFGTNSRLLLQCVKRRNSKFWLFSSAHLSNVHLHFRTWSWRRRWRKGTSCKSNILAIKEANILQDEEEEASIPNVHPLLFSNIYIKLYWDSTMWSNIPHAHPIVMEDGPITSYGIWYWQVKIHCSF